MELKEWISVVNMDLISCLFCYYNRLTICITEKC